MQRSIIALLAAALLVLACAAPALAQTSPMPVPASAQVASFISISILDQTPPGLNFGSHNPGDQDVPVDGSEYSMQPPIKFTIAKETNTAINLQVKGTDFVNGGRTMAIGNASWSILTNPGTGTAMTSDYTTMSTIPASTGVDQYLSVYHWMDFPIGQAAGTYSATFYYQATPSP